MRIAFDGAGLGEGPITGVGRAFLNALAAYAPLAPGLLLLLPEGATDPGVDGVEVVPAPRGALRRQLTLPRLLRRMGADLLHSSVAAVPLRAPCPTIATVHDLPWLCPESGERTARWTKFAARTSLRSATAVIAPSRYTLDAAQQLLAGGKARLEHIPHGVELPAGAPAHHDRRHGPLLVLGDDRPRKNRARVRQACALARAACPSLPPMRFVGPPGDYVDEAEKSRLLRQCRALVQCSLFEGFGMPVLEGLAHGAPVLCADIPPFREIAGDAALFVDPRDVEAIAAGLVRIHVDATERGRCAETGRRRAAAMSSDAVAVQWLALHRELAS